MTPALAALIAEWERLRSNMPLMTPFAWAVTRTHINGAIVDAWQFVHEHAPTLLAALKEAERESEMWQKNLEHAQADNAANADALMLALKDAERVREARLLSSSAPLVAGGEALREALRNFFNAVTRECGEQPDVPEWVRVRDLLAARPAGTEPT